MGVISLILKRISYRFEGVDTWFWKEKGKKEKGGGGGGGGGWGGGGGGVERIDVNSTGTKVVCFSRFLLCLSLPLMFAASF